MEKEFVSYELSLALKEIGYQSPNPIGGYRGGAIFYYERSSEAELQCLKKLIEIAKEK